MAGDRPDRAIECESADCALYFLRRKLAQEAASAGQAAAAALAALGGAHAAAAAW